MVNVLGGPAEGSLTDRYAEALAGHPTVKVHNYGKAPRPGRKLGHITLRADDREILEKGLIALRRVMG
jgi:5-(carboxyamino)imidazole ribonucleotide synthase